MSDFAKTIMITACVIFTLFMVVGTVTALVFVGPQYGLVMTLSLLLAAVAFALLQALWFTDKIIRHLTYPIRIMGFGVMGLVMLALCAWVGAWFPMNDVGAWIMFVVIFLVTLGAFCLGYQIHFKRTVGSFDAALRAYHERRGR